jgi:hypothetical protein
MLTAAPAKASVVKEGRILGRGVRHGRDIRASTVGVKQIESPKVLMSWTR